MALPRTQPSTPPSQVQKASIITEASHAAPLLAKRLAETLEKAGKDPREVYKATGWLRDTDGNWVYSTGDQSFNYDTEIGRRISHDPSDTLLKTEPAHPRMTQPDPKLAKQPAGNARYMTRGGERKEGGGPVGPEPRLAWRTQTPDPEQLDFAELTRKSLIGEANPFMEAAQENRRLPPPMVSTPTAGELFNAPFMFEASPDLKKLKTVAHFDPQFSGEYSPTFKKVVGQGSENPDDPRNLRQVLAHEVLGHGQQDIYGLPRGGMSSEGGMVTIGNEIMQRAREGKQRVSQLLMDRVDELMAQGMTREEASRHVMANYFSVPTYDPWMDLNTGTGYAPGVKPPYRHSSEGMVGYEGQHGEAFARNIENRMKNLTSDIPMTVEPGMEGEYLTTSGKHERDPRFTGKPHEGDVHPFETLDIPPDLLFARPQWSEIGPKRPFETGYYWDASKQGKFETPGKFDWLWRK